MTFSREQLAWAAGLFEGEGSFGFYSSKSVPRKVVARLTITDEDVIRHFHSVISLGRIYGPHITAKGTKPAWTWTTTTFEEAQAVIALLWGWLGARRKNTAKKALIQYHQVKTELRKHFKMSQRHSVAEHEKIKRLVRSGMTQAAVAAQFNRTQSSVSRIVNDQRLGRQR